MKTLYLTCGLPGSGKSTYINTHLVPHGVQVVCPDTLRLAYGHSFFGPIEPHIHAQAYMTARALMFRGLDIVVDECHVRAEHLRRWKRLAAEMDYTVKLIRFVVPADECKRRRSEQNPDFPLEVIDRMAESLSLDWTLIASQFKGAITTVYADKNIHQQEGDATPCK